MRCLWNCNPPVFLLSQHPPLVHFFLCGSVFPVIALAPTNRMHLLLLYASLFHTCFILFFNSVSIILLFTDPSSFSFLISLCFFVPPSLSLIKRVVVVRMPLNRILSSESLGNHSVYWGSSSHNGALSQTAGAMHSGQQYYRQGLHIPELRRHVSAGYLLQAVHGEGGVQELGRLAQRG